MPTISIWILNFVEYIELFLLSIVIKSTMKKSHYIVHGPVQQFSTAFFDQPWLHSPLWRKCLFCCLCTFNSQALKAKAYNHQCNFCFMFSPILPAFSPHWTQKQTTYVRILDVVFTYFCRLHFYAKQFSVMLSRASHTKSGSTRMPWWLHRANRSLFG